MAKGKALRGSNGVAPMIGGSAVVPPNKNNATPANLRGKKAGKAKGGKGVKSIQTQAGKSGIMRQPQGGGYS